MIKIRLEKWARAIVFQVLSMDEDLRNKKGNNGLIFDNGNLYLRSIEEPEIDCDGIFLWGDNYDGDFQICYMIFVNNKSRDEFYDRILKLFKDYNDRKNEINSHEENIFILN